MIDFSTAKKPRSKHIDRYIDFDVNFNGECIPYTATPDDPASKETYQQLYEQNKVSIAPGENYDWINSKWVERTQEQIDQINKIDNTNKIRELSNQIEALKDKIEFGTATQEDEAKLLELRKQRSELV
ncbi:tail fiber assembly protein [Atlantibacter hermannii]|uniref:Uncharacterized protein n=1 Tax=Atlantibacter hermannii NBRC 105704 TaxID=1115512 RepID=H5V1Z1_ATLHE|nr:tail fiber assembly protein [Atlantibacter hermannii]QPS93806.1 tail fiber assembly protein [Atlantibacter hermannii]GAB51999.1 hypothetical protein EH105704_05_00050 [Atlantibacter hermannii NBRC 105704]VDZ73276.1 Uncharacterised protein [Atlantibacter hermannii]